MPTRSISKTIEAIDAKPVPVKRAVKVNQKALILTDQQKTQQAKLLKVGATVKELNKHYRELNKNTTGSIIRTGHEIPSIRKVPFREPTLDWVSDGGIPIGRVTEMLGETHSGKTRNALRSMSQFQCYCFNCGTPGALSATWKELTTPDEMPELIGCSCSNCEEPETRIQVLVDVEGTTDPIFLAINGVDPHGIIYTRPPSPSTAVDIVDALLQEVGIGLILLDSIGSMGGDKEVEKAAADIKMNQNAVFFNMALRKWQMSLNNNTNQTGKENGITLIVVNQSYQTLDTYSVEVPQGGRGLRHGKALSLKTKIIERNKDKDGETTFGVHVRITNEKNKSGMPYRKKEYYLNLDTEDPEIPYCGTNKQLQYVELAIKFGIIKQAGAWFSYGDQKWQGKDKIMLDFPKGATQEVDNLLYNKK